MPVCFFMCLSDEEDEWKSSSLEIGYGEDIAGKLVNLVVWMAYVGIIIRARQYLALSHYALNP